MRDREDKLSLGGWWIWVTLLMIVSITLLTVTGTFSKWFGVAMEREIFESSYQKTAADKSRANMLRAQAAELEARLTREEDPAIRADIEASLAAIRIQLNAHTEE